MKTIAKITIRNATKRQLADYISDVSKDAPDYNAGLSSLQRKARACEQNCKRWWGERITFEEWAN